MTVTSEGRQFDRLATMWFGDIEVFRTSTAQPKPHPGIVWTYMKDMTAYYTLFLDPQTVIFDLGNSADDKYNGSFHVVVSAHFWRASQSSPHPEPADYIYAISAQRSSSLQASSFSFPGERASAVVALPPNINRAILTVAATPQGDEEFWWSHIPEAATDYFKSSGRGNGGRLPGMSSFREIRVRIDDALVGLVWPFPVVFNSGIAPPLHRPAVGLQTFDLREYEIDVTPWLYVLCDGAEHTVSMEVVAVDDSTGKPSPEFVEAPSHWVLSGKIFIWADSSVDIMASAPQSSINEINYVSEVSALGPAGFEYKQSISRAFNATAVIKTTDYGREVIQWTQSFSMRNDGVMEQHGLMHKVDARYMGQGSSRYGDDPAGLWTAFKYPIKAVYRYSVPDPKTNVSLSVSANLEQELDLVTMGHTPFATGVEPFLEKLRHNPVAGTKLHVLRRGLAYFSQHGDEYSTGSGVTEQLYRLWAVADSAYSTPFSEMNFTDRSTELRVAIEPNRLYERYLKLVNDTTAEDLETVWKASLASRGQANRPASRSEFGLFPLEDLGATKAFRHGTEDVVLRMASHPYKPAPI